MTTIVAQKEKKDLLVGLELLLAQCENVKYVNVLSHAITQIMSNDSPAVCQRISDEELMKLLENRPTIDMEKYVEPTDEEWHYIALQNKGRLTKGTERWL